MLAGGTTLGLVSAAGLTAGPVATAGADTTGYTLHCSGTGLTLHIPGAITTGTLPSSVTPGKSFTLTNYGLTIIFRPHWRQWPPGAASRGPTRPA